MKHCGQRGEFAWQLADMEESTAKQLLGRYLDLLPLSPNPKLIPQMASHYLLTRQLPPLSGKSPLWWST